MELSVANGHTMWNLFAVFGSRRMLVFAECPPFAVYFFAATRQQHLVAMCWTLPSTALGIYIFAVCPWFGSRDRAKHSAYTEIRVVWPSECLHRQVSPQPIAV